MRNRELRRQLQRLQWLVKEAPKAAGGQLELQAHWGRYLCVLVAGFLENSIALVYSDLAYDSASASVASYTSAALSKIQNPNTRRFVDTAREFQRDWADALEKYLDEGGRREAIDGIMNQRHLIVHGRDAGITVARVADYLEKSVEVIEFIEDQCAGS